MICGARWAKIWPGLALALRADVIYFLDFCATFDQAKVAEEDKLATISRRNHHRSFQLSDHRHQLGTQSIMFHIKESPEFLTL
tara:strand:- start:93804 stop:94052 length:249 start_codon:yes stop_codon:yes gene_type:complete